jgi:alcohol dehydrogenase class IV
MLPELLQQAGARRPLLVTDKGVVDLPWWREFEVDGTATFSEIWGNPVKSQVTAGVKAAKAHNADAIVAVGGGAATDVAKAIALMLHHPGDLFDYEDGKPDARAVDQEIPYLVALPTTAGTGSEVGRSAVVSDDSTHVKKIIFSARLLPNQVLADPELTVGLPPSITAATGMDAITHLMEAYLAKGENPLCDGIALEGLYLASQSLADCVAYAAQKDPGSPDHLDKRKMMLNASMMGAIAFQKGLGVTHSMAHALSTVCDLHHGLANGILVPICMKFNQEVVPNRFDRMAQIVGVPDIPTWLAGLNTTIGIPRTLSAVGVDATHIDDLVKIALVDGCHLCNPRTVSEEQFRSLFEEAIG